VVYAMEYCLDSHIASRSALFAANLREKVLSLHAIGLMHMDIKLENVCFSARLNQFVLVDYGLSKLIPERFG
jgi:serine/threonine protein kinase